MGELKGVNVQKLQGGLGRTNGNKDNHVAIICVGIPAGDIANTVNNSGKGVVLKSPYDAEVIGINESFDANEGIKLYDQIVEFFRLAPEATLYLFNSAVTLDLKAFLNHNKDIKGYGLNVLYNALIPNLTGEIDKHQTIINEFAADNRLIDFAIIGMDELDDFTTDLFTLTAGNVSVCVACEDDSKLVSIGSVLGMIAIRKVNENMASVDIQQKPRSKRGTSDYTLTDASLGRWQSAFLSDGREISTVSNSELRNSIIAKGYIIAAGYEGYAGMFFENSYTCIDRASDFAFIENNRTWNKAARIVRTTLLPKVKGIVKKNPATGFIASTTVSYWKQLIFKALEKMVSDDEISGHEEDIDPEQIVSMTSPVNVKVSVVADGIAHEFDVAIGLTNSI
jgi:hypothetical protein